MYIRQTTTKASHTGVAYSTYRLVDGVRKGEKVQQKTILNIGKYFDLPPALWKSLCSRIEEILSPVLRLPGLAVPQLHPDVERYAQNFAAMIIAKRAAGMPDPVAQPEKFVNVAPDSLEMSDSRTAGVESVGLHAVKELQLDKILTKLEFTDTQIKQAKAAIIGRMAAPGSEAATWEWLTRRSALGELLDVNFSVSSVMSLHRISDKLIKHQEKIENFLYDRVSSLFKIQQTVTLYDLTNTFFEGHVTGNKKAARGFSKEKRTDCPLVTLGLMLDGEGFIRKSKIFPGNAAEGGTLAIMLEQLGALPNALVVMDRGIATRENLKWLVEKGYKYLVVSRSRTRDFDFSQAQTIETARSGNIQVYRAENTEKTEVSLYCYSPKRQEKEDGISKRFMKKFEMGLDTIQKSLGKPRSNKSVEKIQQRIGRLLEQCHGIGQHYQITVTDNSSMKNPDEPLMVTSITYEKKAVEGSMVTHPGVYVIRSNDLSLSEAQLWKTYIMLTDVEAVFRSLKSELGLRPIYHRKESRTDGHLFISVLAYQCVQTIRKLLKKHGIHDSWTTLRRWLSQHTRVTTSFRRAGGGTLHIRKAVRPEPEVQAIYRGLGLSDNPGGIKRYTIQ